MFWLESVNVYHSLMMCYAINVHSWEDSIDYFKCMKICWNTKSRKAAWESILYSFRTLTQAVHIKGCNFFQLLSFQTLFRIMNWYLFRSYLQVFLFESVLKVGRNKICKAFLYQRLLFFQNDFPTKYLKGSLWFRYFFMLILHLIPEVSQS